jgi:hypothetical protein
MATRECVNQVEGAGTKRKAELSPIDIKTADLFHSHYINHKISPTKGGFACDAEWSSPEGQVRIAAWLKVVAVDQIRFYERIKRTSVAALFPLVIATLQPVLDLCDLTICAVTTNPVERDDLERVAGDIAESQPRRRSSKSPVGKPVVPTTETTGGPASQSTATPSAYNELLELVDTTHPADVMNFLVYVENWLTSNEYATKRWVEILIINEKTRKVVTVIEAKPTISDCEPYNAGFFQCCAYMALNDVPFGIFTDHKQFQFVRMDASKVLHHSDLYYLMKANYKHLDEDAPVVYAHIFEGLGVAYDIDLVASESSPLRRGHSVLPF